MPRWPFVFKTDNNGGKWVEVSNILKELDDSVLLDNNAILVISKSIFAAAPIARVSAVKP